MVEYPIGALVTMRWALGSRIGRVSGATVSDTLPTGAVFVPVTWPDGTTGKVDSRVLTVEMES